MANTSIVMKGPVGPDEVVSISYIPPISLNQGQTYNLGDHIKDTGGRVTATRVMQGGSQLSSSKLSYNSGLRQLLGGDGGFEGGLTLEVDWDFTLVSNEFSSTITANPSPSVEADFIISSGTSTFDGSVSQPLAAGGSAVPNTLALTKQVIIQIPGGRRGHLNFKNIRGTAGNRITIRNDPEATEPAILEVRSVTDYPFQFQDCRYFNFDGTGKYVGAPSGVLGIDTDWTEGRTQAGIIVRNTLTTNSCNGFLSTRDVQDFGTMFFTIKGVEIDGGEVSGYGDYWRNNPSASADGDGFAVKPGIGFPLYDRSNFQKPSTYATLWREGIIIENCYFHDTHNEGIYAGSNFAKQGASSNPENASARDADLRNIKIRYCLFERNGFFAAQIKGAFDESAGTNEIHHCASYWGGMRAASTSTSDPGHSGAFQLEGSAGSIHHNKAIDSARVAIKLSNLLMDEVMAPSFTQSAYNNLIVRAGFYWFDNWGTTNQPDSLFVTGDADQTNGWTGQTLSQRTCNIYNNTVVDAYGAGINGGAATMRVSGGVLRDNIVAGSGGVNLKNSTNNYATTTNNLTSSTKSWNLNWFVSPTVSVPDGAIDSSGDWHLVAGTTPVDNAPGSIATTDLDDVSRPQGSAPDQGCYEYI